MAASTVVEIQPADLRKLDRAIDRLGDKLPLMRAIAKFAEDSTRQRFPDQVGPDGQPWKPSLRAQLQGGRTLIKDTHLWNSIQSRASSDEAEVGTNVIYAAIHQFGGVIRAKGAGALRFQLPGGGFATVKSVTMPARPFLGVNDEDQGEIAGLVQDFIDMAAAA